MVKLTYVTVDGAAQDVEAKVGLSLMTAAVNNGVAGIEGECGGVAACATCHVYIAEPWRKVTGVASEHELQMLEFGSNVDERSRLGCQIILTEEMNGLTVLTPATQR